MRRVSKSMIPGLLVWSVALAACGGDPDGGTDAVGADVGPSDAWVDSGSGVDSGGAQDADATGVGDTPSVDAEPTDAVQDFGLEDATADTVVELPEPEPDPVLPMRAAGWMSGDLHLHTVHSDGEDPVRVVIALAEYLSSETFLAAHPEYRGNPIDFIALTDHRTVAQNSDPEFVSGSVILIPGEEFGGPGHANIFGVTEFVPHDPDRNGANAADYQAGPGLAHDQGALFSINHPTLTGIPFPWDVRNHDAMEIWNAGWGLHSTPYSETLLAKWEAANGPASPLFHKVLQYQGGSASSQALRLYEAQLARGIHVAVVAGSDRHVVFPVGFPTTWLHATSRDLAGVLDGIRARHTFVSRTPVSATVELEVAVGDVVYAMGDAIPVPSDGVSAEVTVRVRRAEGARVRLIQGARVATDEALADAALGQVAFETMADSRDFEAVTTLELGPGDWFYPVVHEPLVPQGLDAELVAAIPSMAAAMGEFSDENYAPLITALIDYIDTEILLYPEDCDPATWNPNHLQCLPADDFAMATYFIPDWINRVINILAEDGQMTDWTMGAVGSAVMARGMTE